MGVSFLLKDDRTIEKKVPQGCLCLVANGHKFSGLCFRVTASVSCHQLQADTFCVDLFFQKGMYELILCEDGVCKGD